MVESAKDWKIAFDRFDQKTGIISGSVCGVLLPSKYNNSPYPTMKSVSIDGKFSYKLNTIHPVMEAYRAKCPAYAKRFRLNTPTAHMARPQAARAVKAAAREGAICMRSYMQPV